MTSGITDPQALGAAVREARTVRHWTQADLADRAKVSRPFVLELERGARPRAELSRVLAVIKALGKSIVLTDTPSTPFDDLLDEVLE